MSGLDKTVPSKFLSSLSLFDWQAISAIATFLAVLVALWPIVGKEIRRRAIARNLRARLLAQITVIRPIIARRIANTQIGPFTREPLSNDEAREVVTIEEMFSQADVLAPKEHDLLTAVVANLKGFRIASPVSPDTTHSVLRLLDQMIKVLEEGGFRRSRHQLKLPWSS